MPQQTINIGAAPDDGTGDTLRVGGNKINDNFTELYTDKADKAGGTFTGDISVPDEAYDATAWNGSLEVPTKNAVRDKIESLSTGGGVDVEDEGVSETVGATTLNFVGAGVTAADAGGGVVDITIPGGGVSDLDDLSDVDLTGQTTGDVLTYDGSQWGPAAPSSGSMALISEVVTSGSQTDVTFSSISSSYRDLVVVVRGRGTNASPTVSVLVQYNADTGTNYMQQRIRYSGTASAIGQATGQTSIAIDEIPAASATASYAGWVEARIFDYKGTTFFKVARWTVGGHLSTSANNNEVGIGSGQWNSTSAITSVKVSLSAGGFVNNSVVSLYGML